MLVKACTVVFAVFVAAQGPVAAEAATTSASSLRVTVVGTPEQSTAFAGVSEYDRSNITSSNMYAHPNVVDVTVGGGTRNTSFELHLEPPDGQSLHDGTYYGDDVYGNRGLAWVNQGSDSCQNVQFTIADIASSGTTVTRLDVQFQTVCASLSSVDGTLFGELSFGEPNPVSSIVTGTRSFVWPDIPVDVDTPVRVPVWLRNRSSSAVQVGQATRSGANAGDFRLASDACTHHVLAAHAACQILITFHPTAGGRRVASLTVPVGGTALSTQLAGVGSPGTTLLRMSSSPGEYVGGGRTYLITNAEEQMRVGLGGPAGFYGEVGEFSNEPETWMVMIAAPSGAVAMTLGTHAATRSGENGTWQLQVAGDGRGCNDSSGRVTISQSSFDADNRLIAFHASFVQTCLDPGSTGSLTGDVDYHATK